MKRETRVPIKFVKEKYLHFLNFVQFNLLLLPPRCTDFSQWKFKMNKFRLTEARPKRSNLTPLKEFHRKKFFEMECAFVMQMSSFTRQTAFRRNASTSTFEPLKVEGRVV